MASRAVWKGQLRLSLVSIPIEIHTATKTGRRVAFRQIHGPSGKPVNYEKTVPGIGKVSSDEILKGYSLGDNEYLLIDPEEIDAIKLETKKTFELVQFVGTNEISPLYYDQPYYIVPADDLAEDAYRVVRDALRKAQKTGIGQLTLRGREHLCAVRPCGDGLLMETLFYADEIKDADPLFSTIEDDEADPDLLSVATALIDTGSRMDEVIFEEFKGTGNMELRLSRHLAERRIFPAVDVNASGTRREENLMSPEERKIMWKLRRVLAALDSQQGIELLLDRLRKTKSNYEFLLQVQQTSSIKLDDEDDA